MSKLGKNAAFFSTERDLTTFRKFPKTITFQLGPAEVKRLQFFVDLWHVQKIVQPVGLPNILPIVECSKNKMPLPRNVVKTLVKVGLT